MASTQSTLLPWLTKNLEERDARAEKRVSSTQRTATYKAKTREAIAANVKKKGQFSDEYMGKIQKDTEMVRQIRTDIAGYNSLDLENAAEYLQTVVDHRVQNLRSGMSTPIPASIIQDVLGPAAPHLLACLVTEYTTDKALTLGEIPLTVLQLQPTFVLSTHGLSLRPYFSGDLAEDLFHLPTPVPMLHRPSDWYKVFAGAPEQRFVRANGQRFFEFYVREYRVDLQRATTILETYLESYPADAPWATAVLDHCHRQVREFAESDSDRAFSFRYAGVSRVCDGQERMMNDFTRTKSRVRILNFLRIADTSTRNGSSDPIDVDVDSDSDSDSDSLVSGSDDHLLQQLTSHALIQVEIPEFLDDRCEFAMQFVGDIEDALVLLIGPLALNSAFGGYSRRLRLDNSVADLIGNAREMAIKPALEELGETAMDGAAATAYDTRLSDALGDLYYDRVQGFTASFGLREPADLAHLPHYNEEIAIPLAQLSQPIRTQCGAVSTVNIHKDVTLEALGILMPIHVAADSEGVVAVFEKGLLADGELEDKAAGETSNGSNLKIEKLRAVRQLYQLVGTTAVCKVGPRSRDWALVSPNIHPGHFKHDPSPSPLYYQLFAIGLLHSKCLDLFVRQQLSQRDENYPWRLDDGGDAVRVELEALLDRFRESAIAKQIESKLRELRREYETGRVRLVRSLRASGGLKGGEDTSTAIEIVDSSPSSDDDRRSSTSLLPKKAEGLPQSAERLQQIQQFIAAVRTFAFRVGKPVVPLHFPCPKGIVAGSEEWTQWASSLGEGKDFRQAANSRGHAVNPTQARNTTTNGMSSDPTSARYEAFLMTTVRDIVDPAYFQMKEQRDPRYRNLGVLRCPQVFPDGSPQLAALFAEFKRLVELYPVADIVTEVNEIADAPAETDEWRKYAQHAMIHRFLFLYRERGSPLVTLQGRRSNPFTLDEVPHAHSLTFHRANAILRDDLQIETLASAAGLEKKVFAKVECPRRGCVKWKGGAAKPQCRGPLTGPNPHPGTRTDMKFITVTDNAWHLDAAEREELWMCFVNPCDKFHKLLNNRNPFV
ncbi:hypothetical protein HDU93_006679 [Gonapodya sp. JEL0774]|nr:hypothetical protein HDU93_006679 [Gonapodya sp. JEL0774]